MYQVTRQKQYHSGDRVVEIASKEPGPDALVEQYRDLGEGKTFSDPREAVKAAIAIRKAWAKDLLLSYRLDRRPPVLIAYGVGGGYMGIEEEGEGDAQGAIDWAERKYEALPKCDQCGDPLPGSGYTHWLLEDERFCSENCADLRWEEWQKQLVEDSEEAQEAE